jgi:hypothetical protein
MRTLRTSPRQARLPLWALMLALVTLACSSIDDVIGQRPAVPTPTLPPFATATPGGRMSVSLLTPTGEGGTPVPTGTPFGQIVAPAATATAAMQAIQTATAQAARAANITLFQPSGCPPLSGPLPPEKPASFNQYPEMVGRYLSAGGPPTILEALLRSWGALHDWGVVQADTDITGDGITEIIVNLYDPAFYQAERLSPGQLLVFGCSQGGYRLLYATAYSLETMLPELRRVGDMNGDIRAELAFSQKLCTGSAAFTGRCTSKLDILNWNSALGIFKPIHEQPIDATYGRVTILDVDNDGNLEVIVQYPPLNDAAAGPQRNVTDIWDWNGVVYVLAMTQVEKATYRIHLLHDADYLFKQQDWRNAVRLYDRVRDDAKLQPWTLPNESATLRAYAGYRKVLAEVAAARRNTANRILETLIAENPPGTAGEIYAALGRTFMESYNRRRDRKLACEVVLRVVTSRTDALSGLNAYGYANPSYAPLDLCPFTEK